MLLFLAAQLGQSIDAPVTMEGPPSLNMLSNLPGFPREEFLASPNKNVRLNLVVGPDGRVRRCDILASSGTAAVDKKMCGLLKSYARFGPPVGSDGKPAFGQFQSSVAQNAELPIATRPLVPLFDVNDYPMEALQKRESGAITYDVETNAKGKVVGCTIVSSSGSRSLDRATCEITRKRGRYAPKLDASGRAVAAHYTEHVVWKLPN